MHIVECDADVAFVSELASISERRIMHTNGKHSVLRRLIFKDTNSIGMVDQDPLRTQPKKFLQRFTEVSYSADDKLKIRSLPRRHNHLIILCPRLEEWILEASRRAGIDVQRYNLPRHPNNLHAVINFRLNRLRQLTHDLMQRSNRVRTLQTHLI